MTSTQAPLPSASYLGAAGGYVRAFFALLKRILMTGFLIGAGAIAAVLALILGLIVAGTVFVLSFGLRRDIKRRWGEMQDAPDAESGSANTSKTTAPGEGITLEARRSGNGWTVE